MNELDLFAAAIAIADPAERAQLLDRECAGRPELRQQLDQLLDAHANPHSVLDTPDPDATAAHVSALSLVGTVVAGRYRLLEAIGEGGMGTVFVAEQTEPVKRKVALKLIKPGMDSKSVLARFEAERQALALMDHPNIARVFDGGITNFGRPFFVMEYVKGVSITEYCDKCRLSIDERLKLFVQVCLAVQHAHQKGVIHRDLKPSNILVAPYDDRPMPKVIDFGLAKAMHQSLTEMTLHTAHETALGTPLYMSPEQAQLNNIDVDTRSDIYSLGVLLYELLTGTTPLEKQRFKQAAWDEVRRIIREEEPPRPSTRLSSTNTLPSLAASRQTEPKRLTGLVRGELDWIVMKSLEKDRTRRYETANGLAMDVERFLTGEPVLAVPPSTSYRLRKFARKHQAMLTTAAAIAVLLLTGIAGTTWGMVRAARAAEAERQAKLEAQEQRQQAVQSAQSEAAERKRAEVNEAKAKASAAEANAVVKFVQDQVYARGQPVGQGKGLGHDVKLLDAVKASLPALSKGLKDQPLIEARLRWTQGIAFLNLGEASAAAEQFERVRAIYQRVLPNDHSDALMSIVNLANSYVLADRHAEALKLVEEFLPKADLPGVHRSLYSQAIGICVQCYQKTGDLAGCRSMAELLEKRNPSDANSLYTVACCRAMTAALQAKTPGPDSTKLAKEEADKAMAWLQKAVAAGWKDAAHIRKDSDLDPLRDREDFKKLVGELQAQAAPGEKK